MNSNHGWAYAGLQLRDLEIRIAACECEPLDESSEMRNLRLVGLRDARHLYRLWLAYVRDEAAALLAIDEEVEV